MDKLLVVGAGPVGLAMGCELLRHGVPVRVVDASPEPSRTSKALGVMARTLEVLGAMGVVDRFLAGGRKVYGANAYANGKRIVHFEVGELDSPYSFALIHPQSDTERVFAERLGELGGTVERGTRLVSLAQDDRGVRATLVHAGGREEIVETPWLVGCDGAHSAVRHSLDLPFEGIAYDEAFALADVRLDWPLPDDESHAFLGPEGVIVGIPLPAQGAWRLVTDAAIENPTLDDFARILAARGAPPAKLSDASWIAPFRIHRRIVPKYRTGRVFLAGDAAHIHSPVGGQGLNTGVQDAFNLAWKLALVHQGRAAEGILDSYEAERRPVAAVTLQGTDLATRVVTLRHPLAQSVRNHLASFLTSLEAVQKRVGERASELAVNYRKSPIVGEARPHVGRATVDRRVGESPTVLDWMAFGSAPHAGDRAPDVCIDEERTLFPCIAHRAMTLLLFDGQAATPEGYANLVSIARRARERWGALVESWIVVPKREAPKELEDMRVLADPSGAVHRRYGAGSECLYLVRPDGYIGFRCQPAAWEAIAGHLDGIFRRPSP
jgi:2-polyprenyl-6-methoxyphenol hydroxylase-like FAD-dependent oxidoreductase